MKKFAIDTLVMKFNVIRSMQLEGRQHYKLVVSDHCNCFVVHQLLFG